MQQRTIPTYALYGEFLSSAQADRVHYERLFDRSSKHNWIIKPHRHEQLMQVFLFQTADVSFQVGDIKVRTTGPTALYVPCMAVHGFQFAHDVVGDVFSFPADQVGDKDELSKPLIITDHTPDVLQQVSQIIAQLRDAFTTPGRHRDALLYHLTQVLLILFRSHGSGDRLDEPLRLGDDMTKDEQQAYAFCKLIEDHFATRTTVGQYAAQLGVSAPHLNRLSRRILSASPNALISKRRMIEAERLLTFTRNSIAEVAIRSGYQDAPYFNRVFKRKHGVSPGAYRKALAR